MTLGFQAALPEACEDPFRYHPLPICSWLHCLVATQLCHLGKNLHQPRWSVCCLVSLLVMMKGCLGTPLRLSGMPQRLWGKQPSWQLLTGLPFAVCHLQHVVLLCGPWDSLTSRCCLLSWCSWLLKARRLRPLDWLLARAMCVAVQPLQRLVLQTGCCMLLCLRRKREQQGTQLQGLNL